MRKKHIALILPWVGDLPWYWTVWQKSAADRCFDVIVVRKTLKEFSALIQEKLFNSAIRLPASTSAYKLPTGHKLCDFKPMYGVLFAEELKGYDYWAFGDCDVMYGRKFDEWIEKVVAADYEVATVQQNFIAGPFTLIKNCAKCNRLFEKAEGWRGIMLKPKTMAFDELGEDWFRKWCFGHHSHDRLRKEQNSFSAVCWREREAKRLRFFNETVICEEALMNGSRVTYLPTGALMVGRREVEMYHFILIKGSFGFTGDDSSVWVSRGWPFVRDATQFAVQWLKGDPVARRRVAEWWQRRRGDSNWWQGPAWNNLTHMLSLV